MADHKQIKVGLLGLGNVGTGVARILTGNAENLALRSGGSVVLEAVAVRDSKRARAIELPDGMVTEDAEALVKSADIDILVETIGGEEPARSYIAEALESGKHVVTSNKEVIAKHGSALLEIARSKNVNLYYEGAVGGGIPIVHALKNSLAANNISKVVGIMNGTTNYILTKMYQDGAGFDEVLKEAQKLGFAEADPTDDVDGYDVAYKLSILASIAFNSNFKYEDIYFEGIRGVNVRDIEVARSLKSVIKLVAVGVDHGDGVELRVHPVMVGEDHPLAGVNGCYNAVFVEGDSVGETMFYGQGAGELPTASAVVGDIVDVAMHWDLPYSHPSTKTDFLKKTVFKMDQCESEFYLRLKVKDEPGVLGGVASACGGCGVSIKSIDQDEPEGGMAELIIVTHRVAEKSLQDAVKRIKDLGSVVEVGSLIRVGL